MRFTNSALALLWSVAGSFFPRPRGVQAYTELGVGFCVDCDFNLYDHVILGDYSDPDDCETNCKACETAIIDAGQSGADLLGFVIVPNFACACFFNEGLTYTQTTCGSQTTGAGTPGNNIAYTDSWDGSGEICGAAGFGYGTCYTLVDAVPSSQPSVSLMPSESPSTSNQPSVSGAPSESPSDQPSVSQAPSESPSDQPSVSQAPSESPSDQPSVSQAPSESPSDQPSVSQAPSESPSDSDQPSSKPSESPSDEPSSEQSETPSCSPSSSPTQSPSVDGGVNLFYPDWANGGKTCKNDGAHPDYMEINPTQWLSSTLDACCKKFFGGYMYPQCTGAHPPDADDCTVMLYYPDWNGANEGCVADGQEPLYMLGNAQYFLSNTKEECCKKFYEWNYYPCTGAAPEGSGSYYPDWIGSPTTCKADGNMPDYMLRPDSVQWYLFDTLKECCKRHFNFDLNNCLGSFGTPVTGSNEWYVYYDAKTCVQDCVGASPCGGLVEGNWVETFNTKKACCDAKLWYEADCIRTNA